MSLKNETKIEQLYTQLLFAILNLIRLLTTIKNEKNSLLLIKLP